MIGRWALMADVVESKDEIFYPISRTPSYPLSVYEHLRLYPCLSSRRHPLVRDRKNMVGVVG